MGESSEQHVDLNAMQIRLLQPDDIDAGERLCEIAGWNQVASDWHRLLDYGPLGCFVATVDGEVVGTVTTTAYGRTLGWIGMMLVHPDFRRRGIATELMRRSLAYLAKREVRTVKLDATPLGSPVYEQLGFVEEWPFHRWHREGSGDGRRPLAGDPEAQLRFEDFRLDLNAFGVCRGSWLESLAGGSHVALADKAGFAMLRPGRNAAHLGPVIAATPSDAEQLIEQLLALTDAPVIWDVPSPNPYAEKLAGSFGFQPVRELTRMVRIGELPPTPDLDLQFAIASLAAG